MRFAFIICDQYRPINGNGNSLPKQRSVNRGFSSVRPSIRPLTAWPALLPRVSLGLLRSSTVIVSPAKTVSITCPLLALETIVACLDLEGASTRPGFLLPAPDRIAIAVVVVVDPIRAEDHSRRTGGDRRPTTAVPRPRSVGHIARTSRPLRLQSTPWRPSGAAGL